MLFKALNNREKEKVEHSYIYSHTTKHLTLLTKSKRSQSALEYMMTYGWAILIIVIVAVILYSMGIFNPSSSLSPSLITGLSGFQSSIFCQSNGDIILILGNMLGQKIEITNLSIAVAGKSYYYSNTEYLNPDSSHSFYISNFICPSSGIRISGSISITYEELDSPIKSYSSSVGKFTVTSSSINDLISLSKISMRGYTGGQAIIYDSNTGYIYVGNWNNKTVSVINPVNLSTFTSITTGSAPSEGLYDPINNEVYFSNQGQDTISVFDNTTVKSTIGTQPGPTMMTYTNKNIIYESNFNGNSLAVLNGSTNNYIANVSIPGGPLGIVYDPNNKELYIADWYGAVTAFNTTDNSILYNITVGKNNPYWVTYNSNNKEVYIIHRVNSGYLTVINTSNNQVIDNISVGSYPWESIYDSVNNYIFVINLGSNTTSVINTADNKVIYTINLNFAPNGISYSNKTGDVYISGDPNNQFVYVFSISS